MSIMTATDAKNRFGDLIEQARKEPVHIQSHGRDVGVLLSPEQYESLRAARQTVNPLVARLHEESVARWGEVYEALAK